MEVVGVSRALVEALVEKAKSAIKEEAEQWQTLERETVFIKHEFEMMKSFLNTADGESMMKNLVARTWVEQVRDLSYDTEDSIEFVLHLETKPSVWPRFVQSIQRSLLQKPWMARILPLDQAVSDMKLLKTRAEDVNQRNLRYNLDKSNEQMVHTSAVGQSTSDVFIRPRDDLGKHNGFLELIRLITTEDKGLQVVSVCGTGGDLGIVSIIKKVYDDPIIQQRFRCRTWVKLMYPFNPHEFKRSMLLGSDTYVIPQEQDVPTSSTNTSQDRMLTEFMESLKKETYLIVLEDLSSIVEWNAITTYLPDLRNYSRIIVSTQQLEIASLCTGQPYHASLLRKFSEDHSVYAFFSDQVRMTITKLQLQGTAPRPLDEKESCPLIAHDSEAMKLMEQINLALGGEAHRVVSVCGIAGVGKTFLVKTLFHDRNSPAWKFTNAWVNAPHPFDIVDLCKGIYQFTNDGDIHYYRYRRSEGEDIVLEWWGLLEWEELRWLLVIDDLRSKEDWDLIKANLISKASKCCIIVITREESVARHCATSDDAVCLLKGVEAKTALRLFEEVIKDDAGTDPNMMEEAGFIINKCGRLPKLIVALGNYFRKAPSIIQEMRLNANFMYELKTTKGLDSFREVFTTMHSSFQACSQVLKKCIFYLSLFTQSSIIRRSRLVRRWIAEGYCEGLDSNSKVEYTEKLLRLPPWAS